MTNLQKRNQLSALVHKLKECKNDYMRFYNTEHVGPLRFFSMPDAPDKRSEETKMISSKLECVYGDMKKMISGLEEIRNIYSSKAIADLCRDFSEDGMIEIDGRRYRLVEITEY